MKKILSFLLLIFALSGLTGCKSANAPDTTETDSPASLESAAPAESALIEVENFALVDNDICTFEIKSFDAGDAPSFAMNVFILNKTSEALDFSIEDAALNGYMCDPYWTETLEPGESREITVSWYGTILKQNGISTVELVEFTFIAKNASSEESFVTETIRAFPLGGSIDTLALDEHSEAPGEIVLADSDEFFFSITGFDLESAFEYALGAYIENRSDMNYFITIDKVLVNGQPCDPYWALTIPAGHRSHALISWLDFGPYSISVVEELEFTIKVYDADNWVAPPVYIKNAAVSAS